jgi:pimeloyl-ACP methyl ester carboxylesterase
VLRVPATAAAVLLALGLLTAPGSAPAPAEAVGSTIAWHTCADPELDYLGLECATLAVPRDYADPTGPTVKLALTRREHTSSTFQGVLLVNPGGPGASGLSTPAVSDYVPGNVGATYDWIGFDPRGVGASTPALHCTRRYFGYDRPSYVPSATHLTRYWLAKNRAYSAACANTPAKRALLPHLTTLDTVRDMDSIREALGVDAISYYGYSYGTYLGEVYATRYPTRINRLILDGVVNPERVWYSANFDQDHAFDRNMDVFWRYLASHPGSFRLGRHWRAIKRGYYRELRHLTHKPAAGGRLGPDELADAMLDAGYYVYNWVDLGQAYSELVHKHQGGTLAALYRDANMGDDNKFAVYNAVQCSDMPWPGWARTRQRSWSVHRNAPFLTWGNTWYNAPCLSWKAPSHRRLFVSGSALTSKVLLISETRDAATPYSGALEARRLFPTASLVAGVGGTTHASSLSGVPCVDDSIASYLRTGVVPKRVAGNRSDRHCPRLLPPQPVGVWGRETSSHVDRLPPLLRQALISAQHH